MKKMTSVLVVLVLFVLVGCGKEPIKEIAKCEQQFYVVAGAVPEEKASLQYLLQKGESVRACMVAKGFVYNVSAAELNIEIFKNISQQLNSPVTPYMIERRKAMNPSEENVWE